MARQPTGESQQRLPRVAPARQTAGCRQLANCLTYALHIDEESNSSYYRYLFLTAVITTLCNMRLLQVDWLTLFQSKNLSCQMVC